MPCLRESARFRILKRMPLYKFDARTAARNGKLNPNLRWGDRGSPNRVEPIALPGFEVPFTFDPGEKIFTVGSCFARNVEDELIRRGFRIPARELSTNEAFKGFDVVTLSLMLNNYGTPSIYNEFAWAFGELAFDHDLNILEVMSAKYSDLHVSPTIRPQKYEIVLKQREAIRQMYAAARDCRVVIMTLGLAEVWFDTLTGLYLNVMPRPSFREAFPNRFELHVLSFDETYTYLRKSLQLLRKHGQPDLRVLLTVSPVPLGKTHRLSDVLVANSYSKSVLRTAAETVTAEFDFVSYYPSYESVTLSDRKRAYVNDMIHVSDEIVALQVSRLVAAFVDGASLEMEASGVESGSALVLERARQVRSEGVQKAAAFFDKNGAWSETSEQFALEHAHNLLDRRQPGRAVEVLGPYLVGDYESNVALAGVLVRAHLQLGRTEDALALLDRVGIVNVNARPLYEVALSAAIALRDAPVVREVFGRFLRHMGKRAAGSYYRVAQLFAELDLPDEAIRYFQMDLNYQPTFLRRVTLAEYLISIGRLQEARAVAEAVQPIGEEQIERIGRLQESLNAESIV